MYLCYITFIVRNIFPFHHKANNVASPWCSS